ncbi:hypothetical protein C8Q76DRAFT_761959 [Earliella scabrosa]|nr:hypothetical protein C8Q76DRAFT_761959 [Earliella scabrosa]
MQATHAHQYATSKRGAKMKLSFDVLLIIQVVADQTTISRMMQTCSYLWESGEKIILHDVHLYTLESIESFVRYMMVNDMERVPHLRALSLEMMSCSSAAGDALRSLFIRLRTSSRITRFALHHPEKLLPAANGLTSAIAALTSLNNVDIHNAGPYGVGLLCAMRSRFITVVLRMKHPQANDIIDILRNSQSTLEELQVLSPGPTPSLRLGGDDATELSRGPCYPRLQTLVLERLGLPITIDYVPAIPPCAR